MQYEILVMMLWIDGNDGYDDWLMAYPSPFEIHISSALFICSDGSDMGRETHIMSVVMNWWCQFSLRSFASWLYQDRDRSTQDRHQAIQVFLGFPNPKLEPQPIQRKFRVAHGCPKNHEGHSTFDRRNDDPPWELKRSLEALGTLQMIKHQIGSRGLEVPSSFQIENRRYIQ